MPTIKYLNITRDAPKVSAYSKAILQDLMTKSGVPSITITSTARTPQDQARIMYENIQRHGINHQKRLYGRFGDKVIDEYDRLKSMGKTKADIISGMRLKILNLGPRKVSRHAGDPTKINVIDIAPSSISQSLRSKFTNAISNDSRVSKFFTPPKDPAFHLEIPQNHKNP